MNSPILRVRQTVLHGLIHTKFLHYAKACNVNHYLWVCKLYLQITCRGYLTCSNFDARLLGAGNLANFNLKSMERLKKFIDYKLPLPFFAGSTSKFMQKQISNCKNYTKKSRKYYFKKSCKKICKKG